MPSNYQFLSLSHCLWKVWWLECRVGLRGNEIRHSEPKAFAFNGGWGRDLFNLKHRLELRVNGV